MSDLWRLGCDHAALSDHMRQLAVASLGSTPMVTLLVPYTRRELSWVAVAHSELSKPSDELPNRRATRVRAPRGSLGSPQ